MAAPGGSSLEDVIQPKAGPLRREINLPEEPTKETEDSLELIFRMPVSGDRIQRRFLKTDTVQLVYDFIDDL